VKIQLQYMSLQISPTETWCVGTSSVTTMFTEAACAELTGKAWLFSVSDFVICATKAITVHFRVMLYNRDFLFSSFFSWDNYFLFFKSSKRN